MRSFMSRIDSFCYKHPRFGIPNLMIIIVIGNVAVWLLSAMDRSGLLAYYLIFDAAAVLRGEVWRIISFIFVPTSGGAFSTLIWLFLYAYIGRTLENAWGTGKFTIFYLMGMLMTVVYGFAVYFITGVAYFSWVTASYLNLSLYFAFATMFPDTYLMLFFVIPVKIKWLAIIEALYFVYEIVSMLGAGWGIASFLPLVAILNYLLFCGSWLFHGMSPTGTVKQHKRAVDFKKAVKKMQYDERNKPYNRKCDVCGRTDADYPEMEFRFCSRCEGYHCFCEEHINRHVHFSE